MNRFFVVEQANKIYSFRNDPQCDRADLFLNLTTELRSWDAAKVKGVGATYALTFHPRFAKNRYCYICYIVNGKGSVAAKELLFVAREQLVTGDCKQTRHDDEGAGREAIRPHARLVEHRVEVSLVG